MPQSIELDANPLADRWLPLTLTNSMFWQRQSTIGMYDLFNGNSKHADLPKRRLFIDPRAAGDSPLTALFQPFTSTETYVRFRGVIEML